MSVNQLMQSAQVHPELPYVSERLAKNASKLFCLLNEYRPIAFSPQLAARFLNTWCEFGLHEDTEGVIDYLLDQHAGYLNETYVRFMDPNHEREFIQFLNSLERGGPYALIFFRKYPKLLMCPSLTQAVFYSNVMCKYLRKEYENKAVKNPVLKTLVLALTSLDAEELLTILSRPKEPNEDYQATLQIILSMGQVEQKIASNKPLTLHCITKNYLETLSLSLIQIAPLTIPDIIHLLTVIATPSLSRALIRRAQLLQSQAPKKTPIVLSKEVKLALHHMLQTRQAFVDRKDRCVGFEDDIIPCFARFLTENGTMQQLLECDDDLTYLSKNQRLLDAIINCPDTCDAYLQELRNRRTLTNYVLMRMMNELSPESFAQLVYRDEKLLERIKRDQDLGKRAVACNFNEKLSLLLLPYLKYPADKLCELLKETKSEKIRLELVKKFIPVRLQAPIALLNDTLRSLKLAELSNAVVDRYQDYDHINALLQSAQSQELSLLAHLVANKQWLQTILNNIRLTDMANWIRKSSGQGPWEYCLRHIVIPKMHLLLHNDKASVLPIQVELLNMMEFFKSNLAFSTLIYSDEKLRVCITIDILKLTLQSAFLDCPANEALEFKLHLLSALLKLDQINIRHWVELLNDPTIGDQSLQERLLDCALSIIPPFAFGKTLINVERLQTVCKEIKPERILIVLRYLLKKLVELNAQFQFKNGLGSLQSGVDRGMGARNILMIESQVLELLTPGIVQELLLNQQLPREELSILLQLATRKEVLNDEVLLTALQAPNWTYSKFAVFANSVTTKKLHELLEHNHPSNNDDDDEDDEEYGRTYIAKVRLFFTEIIHFDCMIVGSRENEARVHMLKFICCTDLQRDRIFQMNKEESSNWISTIVALLLRQKPASTQELVSMMQCNPQMLAYQYLLLKPSVDAFNRDYYLSLLELNPAQAIQADIIQEVILKAKVRNKISDLIQLFNTSQDDGHDIQDMPGIIARAKWAYDQSQINLSKEHQLARVNKDKFLQLTLLVASLNNEMEYGIGYKDKPRDCHYLDDFVYTDARWLNPLIEIDVLICSVHHALIHEGWLIDPDNPYKGIAPDFETAVVGPLKLNSTVLPCIKLLALESFWNEEEEIDLHKKATQMQL